MKKYKINISEDPHGKDLESLGSIFSPMLRGALSPEDIIDFDIIFNWRDIVGKELAKYSAPLKTKFDPRTNIRTLYIEVPSGGFALEIQHKETYILGKVNAYFGYKAIHKLNINQNVNMQILEEETPKPIKEKLSSEDEEYLLEVSKEIKDEKLKEILIKIGKDVISTKRSK